MTDWCTTTLDQLGRIITGKTPRSNVRGYFDGDIPFVTPSDMDGRRIIKETSRYLTEEGANATGRSRIPKNAVMVSCIGSDMGKAAITDRESVTNQQINSIVAGEAVDSMYVYYDLSRRKDEIRLSAGGSAQPILNKSAFGQMTIRLPPLGVQRAIASVLGALDDKIEQNRLTAQALEELARAIFRAWFVDFEPVKAKAAGATSFPSMPQPVFDALPTCFVDSAIGPVPEGWGVRAIDEIMNIQDGKPINKEDRNGGPYPVFGANGVIGFSETALVGRACVVLGKIGSCGALHRTDAHSWVSNNAFYVTPGISKSLEFVWQVLNDIDFSGYVGGSANPYMPKKNFQHIQVILPDGKFLAAFETIARQLRDLVICNETESSRLAELRDYLLPNLLSGSVCVEAGHG